MTYEEINAKLESCKDGLDLHEVRAEINKYKVLGNDPAGYAALSNKHANISRQLAHGNTHTRHYY